MKNTENKIEKEIEKIYKKDGIQKAIELCQKNLYANPTNADLHIKLGDLYMEWHLDLYQAKQYVDEAITEYQRAMETYMDSATIYFKIGRAFFYKNELDKAINYFEIAIEKDSKYAKAYFMIAQTLTRKGNFQEALENAEHAISLNKLCSSQSHYLVHYLLDIRAYKSFKTRLKSLWELILSIFTMPFDFDAMKEVLKRISYIQFIPVMIEGLIKTRTNGFEAGIQIFRDTLDKAPGFVSLYCLLGDIYRAMGQYDDAVCEYKMAIWLNSLNIQAYRSLCQTYEEIGDYDNAIDTYLKLIQIQPYVAEYHSNLANILYLKGDVKEAISHYQNAITLNPKKDWTSVIAQTLGYVYQEAEGNVDAAISAYQSAYLMTPTDIDIYVNLGSAFFDKGGYDNALTIYRRALELQPHNSRIHCNLGFLYWGKGNLEEAIKSYELSIKYDDTYDIAYNNLGVIYLDDLGRVQKAIELFTSAIKANPNYALAHYNLARSVAISGDKIEAAKLYQTCMELNNITQELDPQDIIDRQQSLFE